MRINRRFFRYDNYSGNDERIKALVKNDELLEILAKNRKEMCGIGTKKVKVRLNKLMKAGDSLAGLYRIALEIEDNNISAKGSHTFYRHKVYNNKHRNIMNLIEACKMYNMYHEGEQARYGIQLSDVHIVSHIVYFDLPYMEQISFHTSFEKHQLVGLPEYEGEWDGKVNSTMGKLEKAITERFPQIIY